MRELYQKNGSNWRRFILHGDGVVVESKSANKFSSKKIEFENTGFLKLDYDLIDSNEAQYSTSSGRIMILLFIAIIFGMSGLSASASKSNDTSALISGVVGFSGLMILLFFIYFKNKKVKIKKVYFKSGGFLSFYYRNVKEKDIVDSFIQDLKKEIVFYTKGIFLKDLDNKKPYLKPWLENLYKNEVIERDEYLNLLKKVEKVDKVYKKVEDEDSGD